MSVTVDTFDPLTAAFAHGRPNVRHEHFIYNLELALVKTKFAHKSGTKDIVLVMFDPVKITTVIYGMAAKIEITGLRIRKQPRKKKRKCNGRQLHGGVYNLKMGKDRAS